jgi:hypothetical protein
MENSVLSLRRRELEARAQSEGLDVNASLEGLDPTDDGVVVVVLGGLLGLPIQRVFDEAAAIDELARAGKELAQEQEVLEKQAEHWEKLRDHLAQEGR